MLWVCRLAGFLSGTRVLVMGVTCGIDLDNTYQMLAISDTETDEWVGMKSQKFLSPKK
ncbi:MAG: hypothetical protein P8N03_04535 [Arenicellales bacterium]|nr:hypothetical protein [Arenicellales bacterium]